MKILVTGANGQLGSEIKKMSGEYPNFEFVFTDINELDITDFETVSLFFENKKPDILINCAAYTAVDIAETDKELAGLINTKVPSFLGKISAKLNCKIIHISTDYVFDGTGYMPYLESDMVNPESVYGQTKLNGEIALLKENPEAIIIRTSWLYSVFGNNFVKTMIRLGKEKDELKVVCDQIGSPTNAADLAKIIMEIVDKSSEGSILWKHGIYHYSNEGVCSWYDFAKTIHELCGIECDVYPVSSDEYPTPAKRPYYSVLNKSKIKKYLNMNIPYWRDSLEKCLDELKND